MSREEEHSAPPTSGLQQRRQQRSCDNCRHRKIRCDGLPGGQCSNCLDFGRPCTYVKPSTRKPKTELVEDLRHQIATLESKLRSLSICSLCAQPLHRGAGQATASIFQKNTPESDVPSSVPPAEKEEEDSSQDELADRFGQITVGGSVCGINFGPASSWAIASNALAVKEKYLGVSSGPSSSRSPAYWELLPWEQELYDQQPHYVYPPADLIDSLLELYFTNVHPTLPILHRPSFERSVAEGLYLTDTKFGAALLAVLAIASRYSDDPRVLVDANTHSSGWKFVAQIQIVPRFFDPSIYEVQFCGLMTMFSVGTSAPHMSSLYHGLGVRFLQHRGAHRPRRVDGYDFQDELWNRAFWCFYLMDRMACGFAGHPAAIHIEDFDYEPPLEVDDEYWELGFTQPLGKPSRLSFFIRYIRLCEIFRDALRRLYASTKHKTRMGWIGPEWAQATVAELDSALNDFLHSVPPHLRWDPNGNGVGPFHHQSLVLYMTYYYIQITVHRLFINSKTSALAAPSLSICTSAARSSLRLIGANRFLSSESFLQTPVFLSAVILLTNIFGSKRAGLSIDNSKDWAQVETALEILKLGASRWRSSGRLWDMLQELRSVDSSRPRNNGAADAEQPQVVFTNTTSMESAGKALPPANFFGVADEFYAQPRQPFEPGTSIEQLLADVTAPDTSAAANGWITVPELVLDDELMSMWMAVPTDFSYVIYLHRPVLIYLLGFSDMAQWDAYMNAMAS
ncbi:fungal-specific transcription factor domain-containing protein [Mycena galericulata]|nr:fungal-specific transcription factor domain-containing protein [Mycena galericulata]